MTEKTWRPYGRVALIGLGLIGSSLARVIRAKGLATEIVGCDANPDARATATELKLADRIEADPAAAVAGADLVMICTPIGTYAALASAIIPAMAPGATLTDVGSVKQAAIAQVQPFLRADIAFVPGHPIAGTENSGPAAGFAELFEGRWCILTPLPDRPATDAAERLAEMWRRAGSEVTLMAPNYHDRVLAITSHLPHLIAYTIVGTASDLEAHLQAEVIKYSASGFRDFTRVAASDPIMWRDIFLNNREAVIEMLGRLFEDIAILQRAIRMGDGATLEAKFTRTRAIRRGIVAANQA